MLVNCVKTHRRTRGGFLLASILGLVISAFAGGQSEAAISGLIGAKAQGLSGSAPIVHKVAIFGRDDRQPVPSDLKHLEEKIGLLFNGSGGTRCTAFCVAPNVVATAAHCLFPKTRRRSQPVADFIFELMHKGSRRLTSIEGALSRTTQQHIVTGTTRLRINPPIDAASDWALFRTQNPLCRNRSLVVQPEPIKSIERASDRRKTFQVAFHSDYKNWTLAYSRPCKIRSEFPELRRRTIRQDFLNSKSLILHHCDTGGASSGSPILKMTENGPVVIGINVGTYVRSKVLVQNGKIARRFKARTIANTGVNASVFAKYIKVLQNADVLTSKSDLRQVQIRLLERSLYGGAIDGVFGGQTRSAIQTYQRRINVAASGLPTRDLLDKLGTAPPPPKRKPVHTANRAKKHAALPE